MYELQVYVLCVMTMKNDAKFDYKLTCQFKKLHHNLTNFDRALECPKTLHFNALLLTKVYNPSAKKVQKNYVWWHWKIMKNLKVIDLCFPKWHEEFGKFSQAEK